MNVPGTGALRDVRPRLSCLFLKQAGTSRLTSRPRPKWFDIFQDFPAA